MARRRPELTAAPKTGLRVDRLETPALVLDRLRLVRNIERMAARARELGVPLRPHLKTPKCVEVAELLADAGAAGFCVSTLCEAEYFHRAGFDDLFYCVPFAPAKARRAAALADDGCRLTLMTDSVEGSRAVVASFTKLPDRVRATPLRVVIEIDVDAYRSGIPLDGDALESAAQILDTADVTEFAGIMSYAGASYGRAPEDAAALAAEHATALNNAKQRLKRVGLTGGIVSFGSTPAVLHADALPGITEARCGIYAFQDLFQAGIGAARIDDIAVSVAATVIARQPGHNRFVIDAGGLALSKDRSTAGKPFDAGYGLIADGATGELLDDLIVSAVSQELGLVTTRDGSPVDLAAFPVGRVVRVLPNHADMTAAAYDRYHVVEGGDPDVVAVWDRSNYW